MPVNRLRPTGYAVTRLHARRVHHKARVNIQEMIVV